MFEVFDLLEYNCLIPATLGTGSPAAACSAPSHIVRFHCSCGTRALKAKCRIVVMTVADQVIVAECYGLHPSLFDDSSTDIMWGRLLSRHDV